MTIQKYIHTPPRKLRLVVDMVRKMDPSKALNILRVTPKLAAKDLEKALQTVLANAKQQGLDIEKVNFKKIEINESMKMRRFRAGTRGRVKPYKKRMSNIKIVLTDDLSTKLNPSTSLRARVQSEKLENETNKKEGGKQT